MGISTEYLNTFNISAAILENYSTHRSIGYKMGFSASVRADVANGYSRKQRFDNFLKRIVVFETVSNGYVLPEPKSIQLSKSDYIFALMTAARWLPVCLVQASGVHEPFIRLAQSQNIIKRIIGNAGVFAAGEWLFWSGYALFPNFCQDMNSKLPIGLEESDLKPYSGFEGSEWRHDN